MPPNGAIYPPAIEVRCDLLSWTCHIATGSQIGRVLLPCREHPVQTVERRARVALPPEGRHIRVADLLLAQQTLLIGKDPAISHRQQRVIADQLLGG